MQRGWGLLWGQQQSPQKRNSCGWAMGQRGVWVYEAKRLKGEEACRASEVTFQSNQAHGWHFYHTGNFQFSSRWGTLMLVRAQPSTLSWATRKCLCLPRLATPSISRYFEVLCHSTALPFHLPCAHHNLVVCLSDSVCGTWPLPVWLPRPGDAILCVYQSRDDLQWDPPNWPDERSRSTRITNILSVSTPLWLLVCVKALGSLGELPSSSIVVGIRNKDMVLCSSVRIFSLKLEFVYNIVL